MSRAFDPPPSHRPKRSLGQNFLVDRGIQARIVEAVPLVPGGTVLEIGPGKGALTEGLVGLGVPLVLVELDETLAEGHRERWAGHAHVTVLHRDILEVALEEVTTDPAMVTVVGNIPYNITTPILFHLLVRPRPAEILLMVQKEVADRMLAEPGTGGYGALSVGVRTVARVERVLSVPSGAFRPRPRVDSAVVRITPLRPEPLTAGEEDQLRILTRALFQWRRKQLGKSLRDHPDLGMSRDEAVAALGQVGVEPRTRPEELDPDTFVALSRVLSGHHVGQDPASGRGGGAGDPEAR
ncbi:MAG: ribosomal RNA small subunit methyltransferase A [Gemmatimonadales bacterium]|nr:MAG: ribosomal RNA small subunit methyltransferase A [Gemmatimonadales bacterium]